MASGYRSGGVDFDDLFEFYSSGAKAQASGRRVNGQDLSDRYQALGGLPKRADVGHRVGGTDLSNLWAPKGGTPLPVLGFNGQTYVSQVGAAPGTAFATVRCELRTDGSWRIIDSNYIAGDTVLASGTWSIGGGAGEYQVWFTHQPSSGFAYFFTDADSPQSMSQPHAGEATANAGTGESISGTGSITCHMRRGSGPVTSSTFNYLVSAAN